jgi:two-component system, chemotaxis family, protein-glutamate methylesterase/glutaminase
LDKIKVLVVDDSALMRKIISDMINSEIDMEAIETARNGEELLNKLSRLKPDVITLDVEMPKIDGIQALREMKKRGFNIPVIMLSSISQRGTELTMGCLETGAFDFLPKPSGSISLDINKVREELVQKIRLAYEKSSAKGSIISKNTSEDTSSRPSIRNSIGKTLRSNTLLKPEAVVIGASTGGPKALYTVITALPEKIGVPIFVVQHMPVGFTKAFAERLDFNSAIKVVEAQDGDVIEKDRVYIAPGGFHMEVGSDKRIHLNTEPTIWGVRPAVDKLFISATKVYGGRLVSVVLTGMGKDGAQGTIEIKKNGGITISEDQSTCTIYGMPRAAYETGMVDEVLPINEIALEIIKLVN